MDFTGLVIWFSGARKQSRKKTKGGPLLTRLEMKPARLVARTKHLRLDRIALLLFVGRIEGVLQRHEVFAGLEGIEQGLLGLQLVR